MLVNSYQVSTSEKVPFVVRQTMFADSALGIVARVTLGASLRHAVVGEDEQVLVRDLHLALVVRGRLQRVGNDAWNEQ